MTDNNVQALCPLCKEPGEDLVFSFYCSNRKCPNFVQTTEEIECCEEKKESCEDKKGCDKGCTRSNCYIPQLDWDDSDLSFD